MNNDGPKNSKNSPVLLPSLPSNFPTSLPNFPGFPNFLSLSQLQLQLQSQFGTPPKVAEVPSFRLEERGWRLPMMEELEVKLQCEKCEFSTSSPEVHKNHLLLHASSERGALQHLLTQVQPATEPTLAFSASAQPPRPVFMEGPDSTADPMDYFIYKMAMANPLLQGLVPSPDI